MELIHRLREKYNLDAENSEKQCAIVMNPKQQISILEKNLDSTRAGKDRLEDRLENSQWDLNGNASKKENERLWKENTKLSQELQAFDLEFLEEMEDMKHKAC